MATAAIWLEKREKLRDSRNSRNDLWLSSARAPAVGVRDDIIMPWLRPARLSISMAELHRWIAFLSLSADRLRQAALGFRRGRFRRLMGRGERPAAGEKRMQRFAWTGADVVIEKRQQQLKSDQECQRRDHDGAGRHQLIRRRRPPMIQSEHKAKAEQHGTRHKLKRGQREFAEKVAVENATRRIAHMAGQERHELARNPQIRDFIAVMRAHRKFDHLGADQAE